MWTVFNFFLNQRCYIFYLFFWRDDVFSDALKRWRLYENKLKRYRNDIKINTAKLMFMSLNIFIGF